MTLRYILPFAAVLSLAGTAFGAENTQQFVQRRLGECNSLAPLGRYEAGDGSRFYVTLPADVYPKAPLQEAGHGATFAWISNAMPRGHVGAALAAKHCWSTFIQFNESARCIKRTPCNDTVALRAKSGLRGVPDYEVTFVVIPF